jgi:ABC-type multidrug transport system fused ATPase/permease subunit
MFAKSQDARALYQQVLFNWVRSYGTENFFRGKIVGRIMLTFLLWCLLFVISWPIALIALILYPIVWVLLLPFRLVGIAVGGVFELLRAILTLPARLLRPRTTKHA